jgi:hypothetical protein
VCREVLQLATYREAYAKALVTAKGEIRRNFSWAKYHAVSRTLEERLTVIKANIQATGVSAIPNVRLGRALLLRSVTLYLDVAKEASVAPDGASVAALNSKYAKAAGIDSLAAEHLGVTGCPLTPPAG